MMQLINGLLALSQQQIFSKTVVTLGNFDGVHLGHQQILKQLEQAAREHDAASVVILFEPQPKEFLQNNSAPMRLTPLRAKLKHIGNYQIDAVVCLRFNQQLASYSAEQFVREILVELLSTCHLIIGDDFRFGKGRSGGFEQLTEYGKQLGFSVEQNHTCEWQGQRVSSSWVRDSILKNDFSTVVDLLGRPFAICGRVRHGDKRGRELGYPTANLRLATSQESLRGVFVTTTVLQDGRELASVSNIGVRPVFNGVQPLLETYILDFDNSLYGQYLEVRFHHRLRAEQNFASVAELQKQIDLDAQNAREFHSRNQSN